MLPRDFGVCGLFYTPRTHDEANMLRRFYMPATHDEASMIRRAISKSQQTPANRKHGAAHTPRVSGNDHLISCRHWVVCVQLIRLGGHVHGEVRGHGGESSYGQARAEEKEQGGRHGAKV